MEGHYQITASVSSSLALTVGSRELLRFQEDTWIWEVSLKSLFPSLGELCLRETLSEVECWRQMPENIGSKNFHLGLRTGVGMILKIFLIC